MFLMKLQGPFETKTFEIRVLELESWNVRHAGCGESSWFNNKPRTLRWSNFKVILAASISDCRVRPPSNGEEAEQVLDKDTVIIITNAQEGKCRSSWKELTLAFVFSAKEYYLQWRLSLTILSHNLRAMFTKTHLSNTDLVKFNFTT